MHIEKGVVSTRSMQIASDMASDHITKGEISEKSGACEEKIRSHNMRTSTPLCSLDVEAYTSLSGGPLRVTYRADTAGVQLPFLHGGNSKRSGGIAEFALPSCAANSNATFFDLYAECDSERRTTSGTAKQCGVMVNTVAVRCKNAEQKKLQHPSAVPLAWLGTIVKPLVRQLGSELGALLKPALSLLTS